MDVGCLFVGVCGDTTDGTTLKVGYDVQGNKRNSRDEGEEIKTSYRRPRERLAFLLPQLLPVFLVNCQLLPLLPPHPDPQLSSLTVPLRLLRHAAAALPLL